MARMVEEKTGKTRSPAGQPSQNMDDYISQAPDGDMSPQSAPYTTDRTTLSDHEMRSQEMGQSPDESVLSSKQTSRTVDKTTRRVPQPRITHEALDDISPTSGAQESSYPQESAWERIRRESAAGQQQSSTVPRYPVDKRQVGRQGVPPGDSFTFPATDEERQLAKQEAQKDFDARVEQERHGNDFEESSRGKRW
jgi:hypothetical protein